MNIDNAFKKAYIVNSIVGIGVITATAVWYRRFLKSLEKENQETNEYIRGQIK